MPDLTDPAVAVLLAALDRAYDTKSWHGTNLKGSLRGLPVAVAVWRPAPGRHNAWEYTLHAAYWKYRVRRLLTGEPQGSFPLQGSDFFPRPEAGKETVAAWKADRALLDEEHRRLRQAVAGLAGRDLEARPEGSQHTFLELVTGAAAHDLYHAGQIQLVKRLAKGEAAS